MNLIAALKELRGRILSGDKAQIGRIFSFPVPDSVFNPYFDDSVYQVQFQKNGNSITQEMFDHYFDKISSAADLDGFKSLFSFIDLDSLQHKDSIEVDTLLPKEGSTRIYWIYIQDDSMININYGSGHCQTGGPEADTTAAASAVRDTTRSMTDTARAAKDTASAASGEDGDEEDPSSCEHTAFWYFFFDGKALHLVRHGDAD